MEQWEKKCKEIKEAHIKDLAQRNAELALSGQTLIRETPVFPPKPYVHVRHTRCSARDRNKRLALYAATWHRTGGRGGLEASFSCPTRASISRASSPAELRKLGQPAERSLLCSHGKTVLGMQNRFLLCTQKLFLCVHKKHVCVLRENIF